MKKISLLIVCILFSCTTLAAGPLLPFLPQPQGESTAADSFQLQQRFLDFELEMGKVMDEMRLLRANRQNSKTSWMRFISPAAASDKCGAFTLQAMAKDRRKTF